MTCAPACTAPPGAASYPRPHRLRRRPQPLRLRLRRPARLPRPLGAGAEPCPHRIAKPLQLWNFASGNQFRRFRIGQTEDFLIKYDAATDAVHGYGRWHTVPEDVFASALYGEYDQAKRDLFIAYTEGAGNFVSKGWLGTVALGTIGPLLTPYMSVVAPGNYIAVSAPRRLAPRRPPRLARQGLLHRDRSRRVQAPPKPAPRARRRALQTRRLRR